MTLQAKDITTMPVISAGPDAFVRETACKIPRDNLSAMFGKRPEMAVRAWSVCLVSRDRCLAYEHLSSVGRSDRNRSIRTLDQASGAPVAAAGPVDDSKDP